VLSALAASLTGPLWPRATLLAQQRNPEPWLALLGLSAATAASAALLVPFMVAAAEASGLATETEVVQRAAAWNAGVLAPASACLAVVVAATLLWTFPVFAGYDTEWRGCLLVAVAAQGVGIARYLFVAGVLWARELTDVVDPRYEVRTGLDALLLMADDVPRIAIVVGRHAGVFEIWAAAVMSIGLVALLRLPARVAVGTAAAATIAMHGTLAAIEWVMR
jgi:GNAT superfamily N-acetyltransferase